MASGAAISFSLEAQYLSSLMPSLSHLTLNLVLHLYLVFLTFFCSPTFALSNFDFCMGGYSQSGRIGNPLNPAESTRWRSGQCGLVILYIERLLEYRERYRSSTFSQRPLPFPTYRGYLRPYMYRCSMYASVRIYASSAGTHICALSWSSPAESHRRIYAPSAQQKPYPHIRKPYGCSKYT